MELKCYFLQKNYFEWGIYINLFFTTSLILFFFSLLQFSNLAQDSSPVTVISIILAFFFFIGIISQVAYWLFIIKRHPDDLYEETPAI